MAHTELSLMPAGEFLAQSYARDLCQSMGLIPELSAPALIPTLCHFKAREPQVPNPRGSREGGDGLLGEAMEAGAAWSSPATSTPQPKQIQTPSKGFPHTSATWMELTQHFSSFPTAHAHPRLRGPQHKPDRSSTSICSHQHIPAAAEPPGSKPSQQPHAGPCRVGNPKC